MCLEVNPNGWGVGLGTHVAVFTCIMQGLFDEGLKWPFRGDVTIQVVNLARDNDHHEMTVNYTDETPDSSAAKVTDKERSTSWGKYQFLSHSLLGYNAARNTEYLRGDTLRIRISKVALKN